MYIPWLISQPVRCETDDTWLAIPGGSKKERDRETVESVLLYVYSLVYQPASPLRDGRHMAGDTRRIKERKRERDGRVCPSLCIFPGLSASQSVARRTTHGWRYQADQRKKERERRSRLSCLMYIPWLISQPVRCETDDTWLAIPGGSKKERERETVGSVLPYVYSLAYQPASPLRDGRHMAGDTRRIKERKRERDGRVCPALCRYTVL